jgi:hypothetical protein
MTNKRSVGAAAELAAALAKPPQLTQSIVDDYARINAEIGDLTKRRDNLRHDIMMALEAGIKCPEDGPWLVVRTVQNRSVKGWKEICEAIVEHLNSHPRIRAAVVKLIAVLQEEKTEVPQLNVKVNPRFERSGE